jgi:hypothetical protein
MLRADINLYQTSVGEAVCFSAVADGSSNLASQGAYAPEILPKILAGFLEKSSVKEIYLKSYVSSSSDFRKVSESLLAQIGDSLRKQGIEAKIIIS